MQYSDKRYSDLQGYVGKTFYPDLNGYTVICLLGGEVGEPYFLCVHTYFTHVVCLSPLEVLPHFNDNKMPLDDDAFTQSKKVFHLKQQN